MEHNFLTSIGIITYNCNHLKTEQVVRRLIEKGYNISIYALPFLERKRREVLFQHRPEQFSGMNTFELAKKFDVSFTECAKDYMIPDGHDIYIVTGAGILSEECIRNKKVLNCHPGLIPLVRGLDAFKWAIFNDLPVGNTLHFIDSQVDAGEIVCRIKTSLKKDDTLNSFALRHYEKEIDILSNFEQYMLNKFDCIPSCETLDAHMRMPRDIEKQMIEHFDTYKERFVE